MIVTAKEANSKLCPFAASFNANLPTPDSHGIAGPPECVGPRCMAWDWLDPENDVGFVASVPIPDDVKVSSMEEREKWLVENDGWKVDDTKHLTGYGRLYRVLKERRGQCQRAIVVNAD